MSEISAGATVAVLGAGLMGSAIAAEYAIAGFRTRITTSNAASRGAALDRVRHCTGPLPASIEWCASVEEAAEGAAIVVESLPEELSLKQEQLQAAQTASAGAILCSNTSSLAIDEIAEPLGDPSRVVGTHYLHPVAAFRVVELIAGPRTAPELCTYMDGVLQSMGKRPIRIKDAPGFVINRLQFAFLREAVALVDEGIVSAEDLDLVVRDGLAA